MTPLEGPATPGMTDDNGDRPATADLAMTDDCRVGCGSTVLLDLPGQDIIKMEVVRSATAIEPHTSSLFTPRRTI